MRVDGLDADPLTDFTHITMVVDGDQLLGMAAGAPTKTASEFVAT